MDRSSGYPPDKPISEWIKEDFAEAARRGDTAPFLAWQQHKTEEAVIEEAVIGRERSVPCEACDTHGVIKEQACVACDGFGWREP